MTYRLGRHNRDMVYLQNSATPSDDDDRVALFFGTDRRCADIPGEVHAERYVALMNGTPAPVVPPSFLDILAALVDREPCSFDNGSGCQAHGSLSLAPGEKCPQQEAKDVLRDAGR